MERRSKKEILKDALRKAQGNVQQAFESVEPYVGDPDATDRLVWSANVNGQRQPLPLPEQWQACRRELNRLAKTMAFASQQGDSYGEGSDDDASDSEPTPDCEQAPAGKAEQAGKAREAAAEAGAEATNAKELADAAQEAEAEAKARLAEARENVKQAEAEEFDAAMEAAADAMQEAAEAEAEAKQAEQAAAEAQAEAEAAAEAQAEAEAEAEAEAQQEIPKEAKRWLRECRRLRDFVRGRNNFDPMESNRIEKPGLLAIKEGAKVDALLASLTATWSSELREQAEVADYDFMQHGEAVHGQHAAASYVLALMRANVPVWLHGAAGTGKSTLARYAAEAMGLDYYEVNLAGSLPSAVKGRDRLNEFVEAEFCKAYENGGVICLEEFDAAPPQTAVAINNALANGHFHNDASGTVIVRHPDFRVAATANTLGTGATKEFQRNKIDGATLDRFRLGRVMVARDETLATTIIDDTLAECGFDFTMAEV